MNFTNVLKEALVRFTEHAIVNKLLSVGQCLGLEDVRVFSWPQVWGDCSCGFGGLAGQAVTTAQTVVVICNLNGAIAVYHDGRFAYLVERPTDSFWKAFSKQRLPGQAEFLHGRAKWDASECEICGGRGNYFPSKRDPDYEEPCPRCRPEEYEKILKERNPGFEV